MWMFITKTMEYEWGNNSESLNIEDKSDLTMFCLCYVITFNPPVYQCVDEGCFDEWRMCSDLCSQLLIFPLCLEEAVCSISTWNMKIIYHQFKKTNSESILRVNLMKYGFLALISSPKVEPKLNLFTKCRYWNNSSIWIKNTENSNENRW